MCPDFSRDVRCVLGLPFDAITESDAEGALRRAIETRTRCLLSTPNLNFAIACLNDDSFRQSVLQSDLSVADGWPIVAIAKLIGAAVPQRVAGSSLFERLAASTLRPPVSIYFFGGPQGVAEAACLRLNEQPTGVVCVGYETPGFGSVADMSSRASLERLNAAAADFVVVALGAKKGQAWIQHNLTQINAPIVSHLGAVVNFAAGTVSRAPRWVQAAHLEWLWRIKEEPGLWRRYAGDGAALLWLLVAKVIPLVLNEFSARLHGNSLRKATAELARVDTGLVLSLEGAWSRANISVLRPLLTSACQLNTAVTVDLARADHLDASVIGLLALWNGWQVKAELGWRVVNTSPRALRCLRLACADYLLTET